MTKPSVHRMRGAVLPNLLLLVLLAGLAAAGWYGWQAWQTQQSLNADLQQRLAELQSRQASLKSEADAGQAAGDSRLSELERRLQENAATLRDMAAGGQRNWLLNEAQALASLAQERLLLTADLAAADRLLAAADATLARSSDSQVLTARRALAKDMEAIDAARQVDVPGLVLRLGALAARIPDDIDSGAAAQAEDFRNRAVEVEGDWWDQLLARLPIAVSRSDGLSRPLDDEQARLVRLQVQTALQQAQLALLQGRPAVYENALAQALALLDSWYPKGHSGVAALRDGLTELATAPVKQALPDIGAGLAAIRDLQAAEAQ
ncbi:MAG: uroporphyrinogen-III C-methyltransferase [Alcanivoracaceae bacterium]|jgi:uroporphyrin-3 C-methyltransferase|nr:uroporphyrinogen-III C-methyltransferase [Alcanivoracaceae bacterium]